MMIVFELTLLESSCFVPSDGHAGRGDLLRAVTEPDAPGDHCGDEVAAVLPKRENTGEVVFAASSVALLLQHGSAPMHCSQDVDRYGAAVMFSSPNQSQLCSSDFPLAGTIPEFALLRRQPHSTGAAV